MTRAMIVPLSKGENLDTRIDLGGKGAQADGLILGLDLLSLRCHGYMVLELRRRFCDGDGQSLEYSHIVTWMRPWEGGRV